jgi:hypothetical protein
MLNNYLQQTQASFEKRSDPKGFSQFVVNSNLVIPRIDVNKKGFYCFIVPINFSWIEFMAVDLTFGDLEDNTPPGSIIIDAANNDIRISLKALMGEAAVAMADAKVSEAISKLLDSCAKAQVAFNAASATDLNSYPSPTPGIPTQDANGNWYASFTHTVTVNIPLNRNETSGVVL